MTENEAKILKWELNLIQDTGFSSIDNDKVLVDVMNATNGGDHYLNIETQKNNIKLYVKKVSQVKKNYLQKVLIILLSFMIPPDKMPMRSLKVMQSSLELNSTVI